MQPHSMSTMGHSGVTLEMFQPIKILPGETGYVAPKQKISAVAKKKLMRVPESKNLKALGDKPPRTYTQKPKNQRQWPSLALCGRSGQTTYMGGQ